jgi:hypothetical protein
MPRFRTLDDIDVRGKRVLLRADLNVPVKDGVVTDPTRIERLAPTIEELLGRGAKVIVMSHFGRPKGKKDPTLSLRPLIAPLSRAIGGRDVVFAEDCVGEGAKRVVAELRPGKVALLDLRFHKGKRRIRPISRVPLPIWAISTSTMPSLPRTARTPRSTCSPACCRVQPKADGGRAHGFDGGHRGLRSLWPSCERAGAEDYN